MSNDDLLKIVIRYRATGFCSLRERIGEIAEARGITVNQALHIDCTRDNCDICGTKRRLIINIKPSSRDIRTMSERCKPVQPNPKA